MERVCCLLYLSCQFKSKHSPNRLGVSVNEPKYVAHNKTLLMHACLVCLCKVSFDQQDKQ